MVRITRIFASLCVDKLSIKASEALYSKEFHSLLQVCTNIIVIEDIVLTTNAVLLDKHAVSLYKAGLRRLNISLDAMDPFVFGEMNGRGTHPQAILKNIELAKEMGFDIKVNMVVQKDVNVLEILPMAMHFKERGITLRFIDFIDDIGIAHV